MAPDSLPNDLKPLLYDMVLAVENQGINSDITQSALANLKEYVSNTLSKREHEGLCSEAIKRLYEKKVPGVYARMLENLQRARIFLQQLANQAMNQIGNWGDVETKELKRRLFEEMGENMEVIDNLRKRMKLIPLEEPNLLGKQPEQDVESPFEMTPILDNSILEASSPDVNVLEAIIAEAGISEDGTHVPSLDDDVLALMLWKPASDEAKSQATAVQPGNGMSASVVNGMSRRCPTSPHANERTGTSLIWPLVSAPQRRQRSGSNFV